MRVLETEHYAPGGLGTGISALRPEPGERKGESVDRRVARLAFLRSAFSFCG
jgi:hypothetical protein